MKLTTRGRYAVTAMLDLALHNEQGPISLADISTRQAISLSYLEQLFSRLRKKGLVESARGPGGGYLLGQPMAEISVSDVVGAVDEHVDVTRCGGQHNCHDDLQCLTHDLWEELSNQITNFLDSVSLADLVEKQTIKQISQRQDVVMTRIEVL